MSTVLERDDGVRRAYEIDASGLCLRPDAVARPASADEVAEILRAAAATRTAVTPAGAQTSTTGASICDHGILLSLAALNGIAVDAAAGVVRAAAGARVADVRRAAADAGWLFTPDPTSEEECTIGGAAACNASGARSLRYGPVRPHVRAVQVVLADGRVLDLRRPQLEKNTVGYALAQDPVDWFIGSEGTLGVVVEVELGLRPLPASVLGLAVSFPSEDAALGFVVAARESKAVRPRCLEYFDAAAQAIAWGADGWAEARGGMVYVEQEAGDGERDTVLDGWLALAEAHGLGASDDAIRVFEGDAALREARRMRHAVPATMNERGARCRAEGGRKISTDWAVPYRSLAPAIAAARSIARAHGLEPPVIYGHAGNGHPHENLIARDAAEAERIEEAVGETLRAVIALGGTVAAEHGIGKLKRRWLPLQMSPLQIGVMRAVKRELDPLGLLAPGNIL